MSLSDWERNGWVTAHQATPREIADLFAVVDRDLADSKADGLSADWALNIAYNAASAPPHLGQTRQAHLRHRPEPSASYVIGFSRTPISDRKVSWT